MPRFPQVLKVDELDVLFAAPKLADPLPVTVWELPPAPAPARAARQPAAGKRQAKRSARVEVYEVDDDDEVEPEEVEEEELVEEEVKEGGGGGRRRKRAEVEEGGSGSGGGEASGSGGAGDVRPAGLSLAQSRSRRAAKAKRATDY